MSKVLTKELIKKINEQCPSEQGIFVEPYGIPIHIKEPVIYHRFETGGVSGGCCWEYSNPQPYTEEPPVEKLKALDLYLKEMFPECTYLQFRELEKLIHNNSETEHEYYGNSTDYRVEYIVVSELEKLIEYLKNNS